jgi:general secretion pathway protein B
MSYILDALRKADADRERDPARGILAQPAAVLPARRAHGAAPWAWAAGAAVAALAAGYVLWGRTAAPTAPVPALVRAPAAGHVLPVSAAVQPPAPAPLPAPRPAAPRPALKAAAATTVPPPTATVAKAAAAPAAVASAAAPASAAAAPDRIFAINELPADVQRELPKLAISGGVYSQNVAQRMLIVGGQVVTQGAQLAQGVVLDEIRPHSAVLRFRGYKYGVVY